MNKFLLIDGNAMVFRAYYATVYGKRMTSHTGVPTNAVYGFVNMIQKAIDMIQPDAIFVAFDAGKHTFRHDLYANYKGGRKPTPEDLIPQLGLVREFCDSYGLKWKEQINIEADDLLGTLSKQATNYQSYILTGDKDMLQLVDDTTSVLMMKKGLTDMDIVTPEVIRNDLGIEPIQIIDLKGLMGDKSDNYPGINGVGEKKAITLLKTYGSVEGVLEHENEIKGALGENVRKGHDDALLSKTLATIKRDVELDFGVEDCLFTPQYKSLIEFLKQLDMNSLVKKYSEFTLSDVKEEVSVEKKEYKLVNKISKELLNDDLYIFIDDNQLNFMEASINGLAINNEYILIEDALNDSELLSYLANPSHKVIGYDIKRSLHLLEKYNIEIKFSDDVMILASLSDSNLTGLDKLVEYFNLSESVSYESVYGKSSKPILIIDSHSQMTYGCEKCEWLKKIYEEVYPIVEKNEMLDLYHNIEMPLTFILYDMEKEGIKCDVSVLNVIADEVKAKIDHLQEAIFNEAHHEFNINSPKQLSTVLYDELQLPSGKKKSTAADKLMKLEGLHPIIGYIMSYRKYAKIYSTYAEGLKKYIREDGKIHTTYNQCLTTTGRLSSSEPNLQNISVRDEEGKQIRKAFLPDEDCVLISSDYHQIELRMLAHMAQEPGLMEAFKEGIDVHTKTAMDVFGVSKDEVTSEMRRQAKVVNFGIVYGMSDFGLAEELGVSRKEANEFINTYYQKYPGILSYMNKVVMECEDKGYVTTICNRRREIPEIHSDKYMIKEFGKRAAMNAPIQGSAADLIKIAMIKIQAMMKDKKVKSKMILQVHDELIFNVYNDEIEIMKEIINDGMVHAMSLSVPLTCECAIGNNWYEAK